MDSETIRFIREEIKRQINVILPGETGENTTQTEAIQNLFPGMSTISNRPVMHPYGYVSRATPGTIQVVGKQGEHFGNRMILGHRDSKRPSDLEVGESAVYSSGTYEVKIQNGQIQVGKGGNFEPVAVGETLRQLLISLIELIVEHRHLGNLGILTSVPDNKSDFETLSADNLENELILCKDNGRF